MRQMSLPPVLSGSKKNSDSVVVMDTKNRNSNIDKDNGSSSSSKTHSWVLEVEEE